MAIGFYSLPWDALDVPEDEAQHPVPPCPDDVMRADERERMFEEDCLRYATGAIEDVQEVW